MKKTVTCVVVFLTIFLWCALQAPAEPQVKPGQQRVRKPVSRKLPDLGMYGFLKLGKFKKEVKWGKTIVLTPADTLLIGTNGTPAFDVYYSYREYNGAPASGFKNKVYFNGADKSIQSSLSVQPKEIKHVHTQAYFGPMDGKLEIHIDADNDVAESREDNNFHFFVYVKFKDFDSAGEKKPDLIVRDLKLLKDCKIKVTIANVGPGGVPDAGYHPNNGAAIQMYRSGQPWGGLRLSMFDPGKKLKTPGQAVSWIWFPAAANLKLGPGAHTIKVVVDNNNAVAETNEGNNTRSEKLKCKKQGCKGMGFQGHSYERKPDGGIGPKIPGVKITFTSEDGTFTKTVVTNGAGYYRIELCPQRYVVKASRAGYLPYSSAPGFFVVTGSGFQTGNIFLKKK